MEDITIGSPIAGRGNALLDPMVGMFVGTLVLRADVDPAASFTDLLAQSFAAPTSTPSLTQDVPFERVVDALAPERSTSHSPLFQVMLEFKEHHSASSSSDGFGRRGPRTRIRRLEFRSATHACRDLRRRRPAGRNRGRVHLRQRPVRRVDRPKVFARYLVRILGAVTESPHTPVGDIDLVSDLDTIRAVHTGTSRAGSLLDVARAEVRRRTAEDCTDFRRPPSDLLRSGPPRQPACTTVDQPRGRSGIRCRPWHYHAHWNPWSRSGRLPGPALHSYPSTRRIPSTACTT